MLKNLASIPIRVLVTGSRGKSSLVRLLHAGLASLGVRSWGRVTGVLPRELSPFGERIVERTSGGHVEEMRWWLKQVPPGAGAVIMENSAVTPELQGLAARWLAPCLIVWTNARADHQETWGPPVRDAERALLEGIPRKTVVAAGGEVAASVFVREELQRRGCTLESVDSTGDARGDFARENLGLASRVLSILGQDAALALPAMASLPPDIADFRLVETGGGLLASAFSANDPESTARLWDGLGWEAGETVLLYNHRSDRPLRLRAFLPWIEAFPWREKLLMGDAAFSFPGRIPFERTRLESPGDLGRLIQSRRRVFGCGNVAGLPLTFLIERRSD